MQPRSVTKYVSQEDRQNAVQTLLGLGVDLDESRARGLLEHYNWDIDQAASSLFTENWEQPPPEPETTASSSALQSQDYRSRSPSRSREVSAWKGHGYGPTMGALNSSPSLATLPAPVRPTEVVDLTGDDDEDLKRAMAESMQDISVTHQYRANTPAAPSIVVHGPKNRGEDQVIVPSQPVSGSAGYTQDDRDLSQALEASLTSSIQADIYNEVEAGGRIRLPGFPVALRSRSLKYISASYVLQALFAVPQICEALVSWRNNLPPLLDSHAFDRYIDEDRFRQYEKVSILQKLFTFMDLSQESSFNIDNVFAPLELPEVPPHNPSSGDLVYMINEKLGLVIEHVLCHYNGIPVDICPPSSNRLLLFRKGGTDSLQHRLNHLSSERDTAVLVILGIASEDEPNTLESAIYSLMLKPPIPEFFTHTSSTICFLINRPEGTYSSALVTPFSYPARFFLDPYMHENMEYVNQKRDEGDIALQHVEALVKRRESLTKHDGNDTLADMRKTIYYLEHVAAGREDPARAEHLGTLVAKVKTILNECENEIKRIDSEIRKAKSLKDEMFDSPQLRKHPYDLRAVLVHDGLIGREHIYAYLRSTSTGKWFKTCDAIVTEVTTETVLNDSSGLHLNAGPYLLVYSRAMDHPLPSPLRWPTKIRHEVRALNNAFRAELPPEIASQLVAEPTTLSPSSSIIRKTSKRSTGVRSAHASTASGGSTEQRDKMDIDPPQT